MSNQDIYSNFDDKNMQYILWTTYLSQEVYLVGWLTVALPVGIVYLTWINLVSLKQLFEILQGKGNLGAWLRGPFLSYWITQPFIWLLSMVLGLIPGINFASGFLLGWWANLDYYQYSYSLSAGPMEQTGGRDGRRDDGDDSDDD